MIHSRRGERHASKSHFSADADAAISAGQHISCGPHPAARGHPEIQGVLLDYGRFLDARDFAGYSRLFAKDGEWVGGFGTVQGPAAIQAFMEKQITGPNRGNTFHILSNFKIDVHGDTATAWSRWTL